MFVLPTPLSPMIITLAIKSYFSVFFADYIPTCYNYYYNIGKVNRDKTMEEHNVSSQSVDIKEFFSQVTNVSPEGEESKSKYGSFTPPEAY